MQLEKSRNAVFFPGNVCGVIRKVGSTQRRVRGHVVRGEIKNCLPLWQEAHFEVKTKKLRVSEHFLRLRCRKLHAAVARSAFWTKKLRVPEHFLNSDVEKLHAAVARSTFSSQSVRGSEHFLKFRCRKIARRCSENHIFKWTCTKHVSFGPLFEVPISKKCTPLWREKHFQVKMLNDWQFRSPFWSSDVKNGTPLCAKRIFKSKCEGLGPLFEAPRSNN